MCACIIFATVVPAYAWSDTETKWAYSSYYGYNMAKLEARIWVSTLETNFLRTKVSFDATSSSWVFNANKSITNHTNKMTIKKTGLTGSLSMNIKYNRNIVDKIIGKLQNTEGYYISEEQEVNTLFSTYLGYCVTERINQK